jgi:predicted O-methyltransferase YrrM
MVMGNISRDYIQEYIRANIIPSEGILKEMEQYAKENNIPIIQPEVARFLEVLIKGFGSKRILEVGTAIGYSAIVMAMAAGEGCKVVSVEIDPDMAQRARDNIKSAGLEERIGIINGDALSVLKQLKGEFDLAFVDGAKGHYGEMLDTILGLLKPGGALVCDNVLFRGMVASDSLVKRRKITIVKRMRVFLKTITQHPLLSTAIVPIGDGVSVSVKRRKEDEED